MSIKRSGRTLAPLRGGADGRASRGKKSGPGRKSQGTGEATNTELEAQASDLLESAAASGHDGAVPPSAPLHGSEALSPATTLAPQARPVLGEGLAGPRHKRTQGNLQPRQQKQAAGVDLSAHQNLTTAQISGHPNKTTAATALSIVEMGEAIQAAATTMRGDKLRSQSGRARAARLAAQAFVDDDAETEVVRSTGA